MAKVSRADQYMPEEVITQILSWTKATSLLSCKSVCKSWRSIISQPKFTAAHHPNSLIHPSLLLITSETGYGPDKLDDRLAATIVYSDCSKFNLPLPHFFEAKRFIGSCNGFVCVSDAIGDVIYLSNPVIRTCKQLPRVCLGDAYNREEAPFKVDVVFGFDYVSGGSKVLRIKYRKEGGDSKRVRVSVVELYSSNADSWREIEAGCVMLRSFVSYPYCSVLISGPVLDGVLYLEGEDEIVTFDLSCEVFGLIEFPGFMKMRKSNVLDFDGSVAVIVESVGDGLVGKEFSLWTMDRVTDEVFWNKMFVFDSGFEVDWVFVYLGAKQFVVTNKLGVMLYDHGKKESRCIELPSQSFVARVLKHTESFISVEGFKQEEENWM